MSAIIDKPGFYSSKAGKCEVVAVKESCTGRFAIGWNNFGAPRIWDARDGYLIDTDDHSDQDITGPYVEPRKPVEGEVWVDANNQIIAPTKLPNQWRRVRVREVDS